jgi:predicted P-loop ATPase
MELQHNGKVNIAVGLSADSARWKNEYIEWSQLVDRLTTVVKTTETLSTYLKASREEQSKIKDIGGFVGGYINGGKRKVTNILYRQLLTLDIDFGHKDLWLDFTVLFNNAAVLHATHKSSPANPRYRLVMPLSREVSQEEYLAISRKVASMIGIECFDASTFQVNRLMFWPSCPCDVEFYSEVQDGEWLDADEILSMYINWHDVSEWPMTDTESDVISLEAKKQEDPTAKKGVVGAFCRAYDIHEVIAEYLSDVYTSAGDGRYTYIKGTTAAGLIVYNDIFAYSHHGTDPAGGRLCNAFDLVRIHKFGHLDIGSKKAGIETKSFKMMEELATQDKAVKRVIAEDKFANAKLDFDIMSETDGQETDNKWVEDLEVDTRGNYTSTAQNLNLIVRNDVNIRGAFMLNTFDNKRYTCRNLPWRRLENNEPEPLRDVDYSGIRNYIESVYGIVSVGKIDDAIALEFERNNFHPIKDYIKSLQWDGEARVDTLLIEYFGAPDNAYTRAAIRKPLCAAIARVFKPGTKFDLALTLVGPQGTYKSTFFKKLGKQWFSDTFSTVQGKEAFEQLQGAWLIEMAELSGLKKAEVESVKQFLSKTEDMFRPAYGRVVETFKRQCIFFGTTNKEDFLRDASGNRRFMPIDVNPAMVTRSVKEDLTEEEVDQIWAEAYQLYLAGELLYLDGVEEKTAEVERKKHSEGDERAGLIEEYLERLFPEDWDSYDEYKRKDWLQDPLSAKGTEAKRFTCVAEIWCECLNRKKEDMSRYNTREINDIMKTALPDWEYVNSTRNFPLYGKQKYYKRRT